MINERSHHAEADRCMRFPTLLRASALTPCLAAHCTTSSRRPSLLCNTAHPEMSSPVTGQNLEPAHHAVTSQKDITFVWEAVSTNFFTLDDAHYRKLYTPISAFLTAKIVKLTCTKHVSRVSAAALFSVGCAAEDFHGLILCWSAGISRSAGHSKHVKSMLTPTGRARHSGTCSYFDHTWHSRESVRTTPCDGTFHTAFVSLPFSKKISTQHFLGSPA